MLFPSLVERWLPYAAAAVFVIGMGWRVGRWLRTPVPFPLPLQPAARGAACRAGNVAWELCFFPSLYRGDRWLWLWAWLMHASLAAILMGHMLGIGLEGQHFVCLGFSAAASACLSQVLGTAAGALFTLALLMLLVRRIRHPVARRLSTPRDYFDLALLLGISLSGLWLRLSPQPVDTASVRSYLAGLALLQPQPVPRHGGFVLHWVLVNGCLLYFPFSKLVHLAGSMVARGLLVQPAPRLPAAQGLEPSARPSGA